MRLKISRAPIKRIPVNRWLLFAIVVFALIAALTYVLLSFISTGNSNVALGVLNQECNSYGTQLTNQLSINSTACQTAASTGIANATRYCGLTYYCYYSSSCQAQPSSNQTTLDCLCDAFKPTQVLLTGFCFHQAIT